MPPANEGWRFLEILALSALAVSQPLFDVLSRESDFFVAHASTPTDLVLFACLLYLGIPLLLALPSLILARVLPRLSSALHAATVTLLAALFVAAPLNRSELVGIAAIPLALALGGLFALGLERLTWLRSLLRLLAPLSLVIPVSFLLLSPVSKLLRAGPVDAMAIDIGKPTPIVLLVLDELPLVSLLDEDGGVDQTLFPNFARLAASSHWFRNATTVSQVTNYAIPAILTGRYPNAVRTAIDVNYPRSLFTVLGTAYDFAVVESQTRLCPAALCGTDASAPTRSRLRRLLADTGVVYLHLVLPTSLTPGLPAITGTWTDFRTADRRRFHTDSLADSDLWQEDRAQIFEGFLDSIEPGERPTLYFLHAMLPHIPWVYLPSGREYWGSLTSSAFAEGVGADSVWPENDSLVTRGYQRHLLQVAFVDRLLGRLLDRLEQTDLLDSSLLIVTSDHGLAFQPALPGRTPSEGTWADLMAVPLFMRLPGQRQATTSDRNVELVDLLPTIADVLEADLPFEVDGRAILSSPAAERKVFKLQPDQRVDLPADGLAAVETRVREKSALFERGLYLIGPHPDLIGSAVDDLRLGPPAAMQVRFDQAAHFQEVDTESGFVPAQIFGRVRWTAQEPPEEPTLALSVNGVIQAVTRTFGEQGGLRFAVMVPEHSFRDGPNSLDAHLVEERNDGLVLRPVTDNALPAYSIERAPDGQPVRLLGSNGSTCTLDPAAVEGGYVRYGAGIVGWARGRLATPRPTILMAFVGNRLIHTATTGSEPAAASPASNRSGFETSGFRFVLPANLIDGPDELRIFAVVGERGTELFEVPPPAGDAR